jgi:chromosome segregation ATPase
LITFGEKNKDLKNIIDQLSITTKEAKEKFVEIFTSIVSFVKNIQAQKAIMKVALKHGKNLQTKFVEKSKIQPMIGYMGVLQTFKFMKTKEFTDLAIKQINDWCSGKEGLREDFKYLEQLKEDIEKVEDQIKPLLKEIFNKNYQLKSYEGQINGISGQLSNKQFQSDQIKDKMKDINSMLSTVMDRKSRTPAQLEDCYVHTKSSWNWYRGYSYSKTYSYETRDNIEYNRLSNLQSEMQSMNSSTTYDLIELMRFCQI